MLLETLIRNLNNSYTHTFNFLIYPPPQPPTPNPLPSPPTLSKSKIITMTTHKSLIMKVMTSNDSTSFIYPATIISTMTLYVIKYQNEL